MRNRLEFMHFIHRQDLKDNPDKIFLFGDNVQRVGNGGQAAEMRGEPNAIGIPTKWTPGRDEAAYFSLAHDSWADVTRVIDEAIDSIPEGVVVVVPVSGIGTGLAELRSRYPTALAHIATRIMKLGAEDASK